MINNILFLYDCSQCSVSVLYMESYFNYLNWNKIACETSEAGKIPHSAAVAGGQTKLILHPNLPQKQSLGKERFAKVWFLALNFISTRVKKLIKMTGRSTEKLEIIRTSGEEAYTAAVGCLGTDAMVWYYCKYTHIHVYTVHVCTVTSHKCLGCFVKKSCRLIIFNFLNVLKKCYVPKPDFKQPSWLDWTF